MNNQQAYDKIKDVMQIKLNYYQKIANLFPERSRTETRELQEALQRLDEVFSKQQ